MKGKRIVGLILALVIVLTGIMCQAAGKPVDYPNRPITLICPWAAGGSSDLTCRMISTLAPKYLGTTMNVVNRTGGNGAVAITEVANNIKADGCTVCLTSAGNHNNALCRRRLHD